MMNTPSMIVGPSIILLQPHVGRFYPLDLDFSTDFQAMAFGQCAIKWYLRDVDLLLFCLFGIVWVSNRMMNTPSMIVGPSIILLQPHVGRFLASDWAKIQISADFQAMFGHQVIRQRCRLATIMLVWHCLHVSQGDEHSQHDCRAFHHTFTAPCRQVSCLRLGKNSDSCRLSGNVWPSSGTSEM